MKKLFISIVIVLFALSMAYAQKTTVVAQSGNFNTANVNQNASVSHDANFIYGTQSGTNNVLNTTQLGNNNYLNLLQNGSTNTANMEQSTLDASSAPGGLNTAYVVQSGNKNNANLSQKEDNTNGYDYSTNKAYTTQSGNNNVYNLNQGTYPPWQPKNEQYLNQSGDNNVATMSQIGQTQYSEINQSAGNANYAELKQQGQSGMSSSWDKSYSWQSGTNSNVLINQIGSPTGGEYATTSQDGSKNHTGVSQSSWGIQNVQSSQNGNSNTIDVDQHN